MALLLIPEKFQNQEIVGDVAILIKYLESAQYERFWKVIKPHIESYESIVGSIQGKVRQIIIGRIMCSHSCIKTAKVVAMLDVQLKQIENLLPKDCVIDGSIVKLPKVKENTLKPIEVEKISHLKLKNVWPLIKQHV